MSRPDHDPQPNPKRRPLAGLLGVLLPGGGHLYLGYTTKGLLLLAAAIVDATAAVYYANAAGGRHLLLIVYLVLLLPVLYGYSVYDALQLAGAERREGRSRKSRGLWYGQMAVLVIAGVCIALLLYPPETATGLLHVVGDAAPSVMTGLLSGLLIWRMWSGSWPFGRGAAAVILLLAAITLMADQVVETPSAGTFFAYWLQWWPLMFVLLGMEGMAVRLRSARLSRLDAPALLLAAVVSLAVCGVTQYADLPARWLDQWAAEHGEFAGYAGETGYSYALDPVLVEEEAWSEVRIDNDNGAIILQRGDTPQVRIEAMIWVDLADEAAAREVADASVIQVSGEEALVIRAEGARYGEEEEWRPRINLTVTMPLPEEAQVTVEGESVGMADTSEIIEHNLIEEAPLAVFLRATAGDISVRDIQATDGLDIETTYGEVKIAGTTGPLSVSTRNGSIEAREVSGSAVLRGANGHIAASSVTGDLTVSTVNGDLRISELSGALDAQTKHGGIRIEEAAGAVVADTLNGEIRIVSSRIGGSWQLDSAIGNITAALPQEGDYRISATVTFGEIHSDIPLTRTGNTAEGSVGDGEHPVQILGNSSIFLYYYE